MEQVKEEGKETAEETSFKSQFLTKIQYTYKVAVVGTQLVSKV